MSSVIKTTTPFISKELLCSALDALHVDYAVSGTEIVTNLRDYYGKQKFVYSSSTGKYLYQHDSSANGRYNPYPWGLDVKQWGSVSNFLQSVNLEYNKAFKRMEEEKHRLEEERRKQYVESQKKAIIEKAKAKGYSVKETKQGDKIRLVLVRTQY